MIWDFPRDFRKGWTLPAGLNVTLVLRDFQVLTGKLRGVIDDHGREWDCCDDHDDDKFKKDDKCKSPKIDINVEVEEECKFILLELTRPAAAVNLSTFTCIVVDTTILGIDLTVSGTTFPVGACVAVNCENIIFAGTNPEFCDIPISIGTAADGGAGLTVSFKK